MANKLYSQYKSGANANGLSNIIKSFSDQIVDVCKDLESSYSIDLNAGEQLNIIGRIVDRDRGFVQSTLLSVFECNDDGDNECGDLDVQCSDLSIASDAQLNDSYYKDLLKGKIAKNNSDVTIDDILYVVNTSFPEIDAIRLIDNEDMSFSIEYTGFIDATTEILINSGVIIPTPQGVKFTGFTKVVS